MRVPLATAMKAAVTAGASAYDLYELADVALRPWRYEANAALDTAEDEGVDPAVLASLHRQVEAMSTVMTKVTAAEARRADAIRAAGAKLNRPKLAARLIREGVSVKDAKARIRAAHKASIAKSWDRAIAGPKPVSKPMTASWSAAIDLVKAEREAPASVPAAWDAAIKKAFGG